MELQLNYTKYSYMNMLLMCFVGSRRAPKEFNKLVTHIHDTMIIIK